MTLRLSGSIPANIMPFADDFAIDEVEYRRHLEWLASAPGVGGITCNGHAAEVSTLDREERRRAVAIAADTIRGRVPLISGVYAENYLQAIAFGRDAHAEGAVALLVFPLNAMLYGGQPDMVYRHFAKLASAVPVPLVMFMYPAWTGMQYAEDTQRRLLEEIPSIVAIKEWSLDIRVYERTLRVARSVGRHVSVLSSFSTNLLPSLALGADGILSGHGSVICDLQAELLQAVWDRQDERAHAVYERIQRMTPLIYREPMVDMYTRMKEQLVMLGRLDRAASRPPLLPIGQAERRELRASLDAAGLLAPVAA